MRVEEFNKIVEEMIDKTKSVLIQKADEYATEDRLHNFKVSAAFRETTMEEALFGFLTKHLISISDMCRSGKTYTDAMWDEKIGDAINYLLLLKAVTIETNSEQTCRSVDKECDK